MMKIVENFKVFLNDVGSLSDKEFSETMTCFEIKLLEKGDFFLEAGSVCSQAAFIGSGILRTYYLNEKGEDTTYCFCTENNLTTSFKSFISQTPSTLSIQALEKTELLFITHKQLQQLYATIPTWQTIGRILVEKEYMIMEKYASVLNGETAKEKYIRLLQEQPSIIQRASVQHIASYLGVSRETLSRIRRQVANSIL
jgi:CRP-like cAMP-binding protein